MLRLIITIITLLSVCDGARILCIVPSPSYSHQIAFQPIFKELAKRGHDLVIFTTDPMNDPAYPNIKENDWSYSYETWNRHLAMVVNNWNPITFVMKMFTLIEELLTAQFEHPELQNLLKNDSEHFDLVMIEHLLPAMGAFKYKFNCPLIGMVSMDPPKPVHIAMGNHVHDVLYPDNFLQVSKDSSFWERMNAFLIGSIIMNIFNYVYTPKVNEIIEKHFGSEHADFLKIFDDTDMLFMNTNPIFNHVRPLTPSTIYFGGGIHIKEPKPLPEDIKTYLDEAKDGVIYFSLGSNVKSKDINSETRLVILTAFTELPYKVIWKFENDELPGKPDNVKILKWTNQQDILRHPNIKLFITQGGLQSLEEALHNYIPVIVMPFFGDQYNNAASVKDKGLGLVLDHKNLDIISFKTVIEEVIQNPKYKKRAIELETLIKDEPMTGLEKAVWWTEYVIRNKGAEHLKGPARHMPFYQYYYLDVIIFLIVLLLIFLITTYYIVKKLFYCVTKYFSNKLKTE